jgi:nucleoside-diphosphate-sugar epimerase
MVESRRFVATPPDRFDLAHRIMITGATGLIGRLLTDGLRERYSVSGIDRDAPRRTDIRRVDLTKPKRLDSLFAGADTVIDLAALPGERRPWEDVLANNLPATFNVLEAARLAGVRRVVFASSNRVTGGYEREPPYAAIVAGDYGELDPRETPLIDASWPPRPDGAYAIGKVLGEAAARYYSDEHGVSTICLRIGTVNAEGRPHAPRHFATFLSHGDLLRLAEAAVEAPQEVRYGVYYGVSMNTWRFWAIEDARDEIGFEPRDDAERFRD